jgi:hypothetical protein
LEENITRPKQQLQTTFMWFSLLLEISEDTNLFSVFAEGSYKSKWATVYNNIIIIFI